MGRAGDLGSQQQDRIGRAGQRCTLNCEESRRTPAHILADRDDFLRPRELGIEAKPARVWPVSRVCLWTRL